MAEQKRYYWLRLHDDFFQSKRIKKLRKIAGGDTYTIIYLKMQLKAIKTDGVLVYTGLEDSFADELALDLDEDPDNVRVTLQFLQACGLMETSDNVNFLLPYAVSNTGSEGASAKRVRDFRERQNTSMETGEQPKALQCNTSVTQVKQNCNGEIEKEKEIETRDRVRNRDLTPLEQLAPEVKEAFISFMQMRKMVKKPMTSQAIARMVKKLLKMTEDPGLQVKILQQSEDHTWADIYPLHEDKAQAKSRSASAWDKAEINRPGIDYSDLIALSEER